MRREELFLTDMVEAADAVAGFMTDVNVSAFEESDLLLCAVLQKLFVISEAASKLSPDFRQAHPEVEWTDVIALRNFLVHAYYSVDWSIAWRTAEHEIPELRKKVAHILKRDFPGSM